MGGGDQELYHRVKERTEPKAITKCQNGPGKLAVQVFQSDNKKGLAGAQVKVSGPTPGNGQTDAQGWLVLADRKPGAYQADVTLPPDSKFKLPGVSQAGAVACSQTKVLKFQATPPPKVKPLIEAPPAVVVKRPYTNAARQRVAMLPVCRNDRVLGLQRLHGAGGHRFLADI